MVFKILIMGVIAMIEGFKQLGTSVGQLVGFPDYVGLILLSLLIAWQLPKLGIMMQRARFVSTAIIFFLFVQFAPMLLNMLI